jgi:hypothetical protein
VVVVEQVDDQVVDDAARGVVAAEGVLRPTRTDPAEVVAQRGVDVLLGAVSPHHHLAEVRDVEDADGLTDRRVLLDDTGGVLQRHLPAAELRELRAERDMPVVQGRLLEGHAPQTTAALDRRRPA